MLELTLSGENLGDTHIQRGIFQGDSLSPLLFVLCMIQMTLTLGKVEASYEWDQKELRVNHLLLMDDLKLLAKNQENRFNRTNCTFLQRRYQDGIPSKKV